VSKKGQKCSNFPEGEAGEGGDAGGWLLPCRLGGILSRSQRILFSHDAEDDVDFFEHPLGTFSLS